MLVFHAGFTILGMSETATIVVLVVIAVLGGFAVWYWWTGRTLDRYANELVGGDRDGDGVVFAQYVREDDLRSVAVQKRIVPSAAWVERGESSKAGGEVTGGSKSLGGRLSHERGRESRVHVELPPAQAGDLIPRVLKKLEEDGDLRTHLANAPFTQADLRSVVSNPDDAIAYVREYMTAQYPDGVDDSPDEMVQGIVMALHRKAREDEIDQKREQFKGTGKNEFVLISSKWRVHRSGGEVQLWLREWTAPGPYEYWDPHHQGGSASAQPAVLELPAGVGIRAELDEEAMTDRGHRELKDGEVKELGVFGTVVSYMETAGRLEVLPIAVFSRVGR